MTTTTTQPHPNMNMKIMMILSPAKTLDMSRNLPLAKSWTTPECSPETTHTIASAMKQLSKAQLKTKLKISDKIAQTVHSYWSDFRSSKTSDHGIMNNIASSKPCIFAYSGAAYIGLDARSCSETALDYLQDRLRILSAVYGCLRPYDCIQPYRLEMGTKDVLQLLDQSKATAKSLADLWRDSISNSIAKDLVTTTSCNSNNSNGGGGGGESTTMSVLLNLASDEYAAAVDSSQFGSNTRYIKVIFQEDGRVIAVHAKRARGMMVRYLADHQVDQLDDVKTFAEEGYTFDEKHSNDNIFVFNRMKQVKAPAKRRAGTTIAAPKPKAMKQPSKQKSTSE